MKIHIEFTQSGYINMLDNIRDRYYFPEQLEEDYLISKAEIKKIKISKRLLTQAIERAERWINYQVNEALSKGQIDVNKIYSKIIGSIARTSNEQDLDENLSVIRNVLKKLAKRSLEYSKFKIITPLEFDEINNSISIASKESHKIIYTVLNPYIEGIEARLDALEEIYKLLNIFTDTLSAFFLDKEVEFRLNEGIVIKTNGDKLNQNLLSSGEKHLLMLFCNTFPAREGTSIFIIDEPEISLNVKWQRKLIHSLLDLTYGKQVQFIFATHSIELLTQYKTNVAKLINLE